MSTGLAARVLVQSETFPHQFVPETTNHERVLVNLSQELGDNVVTSGDFPAAAQSGSSKRLKADEQTLKLVFITRVVC